MIDHPLVSIGLPIYNGERWIRAALDCLLGQTYQHLEVVVCDNASTDATPDICADYAVRDRRVKYFRNERNVGTRGPRGNFCRVLSHASGEYFMWASADDWRSPTVVEECLQAFRGNPAAVLVHGPIDVTVGDRSIGRLKNSMDLTGPSASERVRAFTSGMQHNAMIYGVFRREDLIKTKYGDHYGHDYLVCLQACLLGPVESIESSLISYHQRSDSLDAVMYAHTPVTVKDLVLYRGVRRSKCWLTLIVGCCYLLGLQGPSASERIAGAAAYMRSFGRRYWRHLARESLFILVTPVTWAMVPIQPAAVRIKTALRRRGLFAS